MVVFSAAAEEDAEAYVQSLRAESALDTSYPLRRALEALLVPLMALVLAAGAFSLFLLFLEKSPVDFFALVWRGAFGSWFSFQNTLQRAAPLLLTALCVALPAHLGLVVIGGEGAVVLGGRAGHDARKSHCKLHDQRRRPEKRQGDGGAGETAQHNRAFAADDDEAEMGGNRNAERSQ